MKWRLSSVCLEEAWEKGFVVRWVVLWLSHHKNGGVTYAINNS